MAIVDGLSSRNSISVTIRNLTSLTLSTDIGNIQPCGTIQKYLTTQQYDSMSAGLDMLEASRRATVTIIDTGTLSDESDRTEVHTMVKLTNYSDVASLPTPSVEYVGMLVTVDVDPGVADTRVFIGVELSGGGYDWKEI